MAVKRDKEITIPTGRMAAALQEKPAAEEERPEPIPAQAGESEGEKCSVPVYFTIKPSINERLARLVAAEPLLPDETRRGVKTRLLRQWLRESIEERGF